MTMPMEHKFSAVPMPIRNGIMAQQQPVPLNFDLFEVVAAGPFWQLACLGVVMIATYQVFDAMQ